MPAPGAGPGTKVRVVGRIRPLAKYEIAKGAKETLISLVGPNKKDPEVYTEEPEMIQVTEEDGNKRFFELDAVFDKDCTQREVYVRSGCLKAVTQDLFNGYNCTVLAYGQTGAGKSFSMGTASHSSEITETDGMIPRACHDLFVTIKDKCDGNAKVLLQYIEIYNEELRDLLVDDKDIKPLKIRETLDGEIYIAGLESKEVKSPQDIGALMEEASGRRIVAATAMNAVSSRSHAMCVLRVEGVVESDDGADKFSAKLTLVDLAGSERASKTGATGARLKEGVNINKSLLVLGQVVSALANKAKKGARKPPYRDSKLTRLLQDSLGGNSQTIMVACSSPADYNTEESINTMRYATSARNIKNTATKNVVKNITPEEAAKLQRENQLLKKQVEELQATIKLMTEEGLSTPSALSQNESADASTVSTESTASTANSTVSSISDGEDKDKKMDELNQRIEELVIIDDQHKKIIEEKEKRVKELEEENEELKTKVKNQEKAIEEVKRQDEQHQKTLAEKEKCVEEFAKEIGQLKTTLLNKEKDMENVMTQDSEQKKTINEKYERIAKLERDNQKLQKRVRKTEKVLVLNDQHKKTIEEKDKRISELEGENKEFRKMLKNDKEASENKKRVDDMILEDKNKRIAELENEARRLNLKMTSANRSVRSLGKAAASTAVEIPQLHFEIEKLREELKDKEEIQEELCKVREELDHARIDADCAQRAAARMSDMLEEADRAASNRVDLDKKEIECEAKKRELQWITFVLHIMDSSRADVNGLTTGFESLRTLVHNMIKSAPPSSPTPPSSRREMPPANFVSTRKGLAIQAVTEPPPRTTLQSFFGFGGNNEVEQPEFPNFVMTEKGRAIHAMEEGSKSSRSGRWGVGSENDYAKDSKLRIGILDDELKFFTETIEKIVKKMEEETRSLREIKNGLDKETNDLSRQVDTEDYQDKAAMMMKGRFKKRFGDS